MKICDRCGTDGRLSVETYELSVGPARGGGVTVEGEFCFECWPEVQNETVTLWDKYIGETPVNPATPEDSESVRQTD